MFSVIIPTFNRPDNLKRALHSLSQQTFRDFEVIVVDDTSRPPVDKKVLDGLSGQNGTLITNPHNCGPAGSRNIGAGAACHEWLVFLDDDDDFLPQKLADIQSFIQAQPKVPDVIYHAAEIEMVNEGVFYTTSPRVSDDPSVDLLCQNVIGGTPVAIVRREAFISVGGFDTQLPALEDYELWLRMALTGKTFALCPKALTLCHTTTRESSVSKHIKNHVVALDMIRTKYANHYQSLSLYRRLRYQSWRQSVIAHVYCMNYLRKGALHFLAAGILGPSLRHLAAGILMLVSPKCLIQARGTRKFSIYEGAGHA